MSAFSELHAILLLLLWSSAKYPPGIVIFVRPSPWCPGERGSGGWRGGRIEPLLVSVWLSLG